MYREGYNMENNVCHFCGLQLKSEYAVKCHIRLKHNIDYRTYYFLFLKKPEDTCFCEICR